MPNDDPIGFLFTWSTYGTWLPGNARSRVEYRHGFQLPAARMTEDACRLAPHQRHRVETQVAETCRYKRWLLHGVNCRTNHVHVVLSSPAHPKMVREQLKAWCTRRLNEQQAELGVPKKGQRRKWWADRGSIRWIFHESDLAAAVEYVLDQQDNPHRFILPSLTRRASRRNGT